MSDNETTTNGAGGKGAVRRDRITDERLAQLESLEDWPKGAGTGNPHNSIDRKRVYRELRVLREELSKPDAATLAAYELGLAEGVEQGIERVREEHEHGHCCRRNCDSPSEMCDRALAAWRAEQSEAKGQNNG